MRWFHPGTGKGIGMAGTGLFSAATYIRLRVAVRDEGHVTCHVIHAPARRGSTVKRLNGHRQICHRTYQPRPAPRRTRSSSRRTHAIRKAAPPLYRNRPGEAKAVIRCYTTAARVSPGGHGENSSRLSAGQNQGQAGHGWRNRARSAPTYCGKNQTRGRLPRRSRW
jgi:hypothetical protein